MVDYKQTSWCANTTIQKNDPVLSDAYLIKIIRTFFELDDLTISCNDMLTKILSMFRNAIARGGLQRILDGFMLFLCGKKENSHSHIPRIVTYWDLKILIAGLIRRFSNDKTLKDVLELDNGNGTTDIYSLRLNGNMLSTMATEAHAGISLLPPRKIIVLDPKQAAVLVFLFQAYYSNNSVIDDSSVHNFMRELERIDENIHGSIVVKESELRAVKSCTRESLLKTYCGTSLVVQRYIMGQYSYIFSMLNECFLRFDFLNTDRLPETDPRRQAKSLMLNYLTVFIGWNTSPPEWSVWSKNINEVGVVTNLCDMLNSGAISNDFLSYVLLKSLLFTEPGGDGEQASYGDQFSANQREVDSLLQKGQYKNINPYIEGVTRKDPLGINKEKLKVLKKISEALLRLRGGTTTSE